MKQKYILRFFFILFNLCFIQGESFIFYDSIKFVFNYLQNYTRQTLNDIILADTSNLSENQELFVQGVNEMVSKRESVQFISILPDSSNISATLQKMYPTKFPSMVVLPMFNESNEVQNAFFELIPCLNEQNVWILYFLNDFKREEEMNEYVRSTMLENSNIDSSLNLHSLVFVITLVNGKAKLSEIYKPCKESNILIRQLVEITENHTNSKYIWKNRRDLRGCFMRVGYMDYGPMLSVVSNDNNLFSDLDSHSIHTNEIISNDGKLLIKGPKTRLFSLIQTQLNFSIKWVLVNDRSFGTLDDKTESWNGIVGMIQRNEIDTSILDLSMTAQRADVISYSAPFTRYRSYLFFERQNTNIAKRVIREVFDDLYTITLFSFIFILATYHFILVLRLSKNEAVDFTLKKKLSRYFDSLFLCVLAFAGRDVPQMNPTFRKTYFSNRILVLIIASCGIVHFYIYCSLLISIRMVQRFETPINSITDILEKPDYKLLVFGGTSNEDYLKYSTDEKFRRLWKKTARENGVLSFSNSEYLQHVISNLGNNVVFAEFPTFQYEISSYQCRIVRSKNGYNFQYGAYPFARESPYIDVFNHQISNFLGGRLETTHFDIEYEEECITSNQKSFRTMSYKDVIYAFSIFLFGCIIAIQFSIVERFHKRRRQL